MTLARRRLIAFLDIGTHAVRYVLSRFQDDGSYTIQDQGRTVTRLGEGCMPNQNLRWETIARTVDVCRTFVESARANGAEDVIAIATAAARDASNRKVLLDRLRREVGITVRIVSGREETRLLYVGLSSDVHVGRRPTLFIDIGGGSTQVAMGNRERCVWFDSLPLGAIRLTHLVLSRRHVQPVTPEAYAEMKQRFEDMACTFFKVLPCYSVSLVVGSSGTVVNLGKIAAYFQRQQRSSNDTTIDCRLLGKVVRWLCSLPLDRRRQVPGMNPDRADIIIGGAAILETLLAHLPVRDLVVSTKGLRDGLMIDYARVATASIC